MSTGVAIPFKAETTKFREKLNPNSKNVDQEQRYLLFFGTNVKFQIVHYKSKSYHPALAPYVRTFTGGPCQEELMNRNVVTSHLKTSW